MKTPQQQDYWVKQSIKHIGFEEEYELGDELGRGPTSCVYMCRKRGMNDTYAVKIYNKNLYRKISVVDACLLLGLGHKNIIKLKEMFESESQIILVQDLVGGEELFDRIANLEEYSEMTASRAVKDIICGLEYLHDKGFAHRNLKPENLLYATREENAPLKITDWAASNLFSSDVDMASVCGNPEYSAPELLKGHQKGQEVDMWALGVFTFILLCGYEPFWSDNPSELFKQILKGKYEFSPDWDDVTVHAKSFVSALLVADPKKRLTIQKAQQNPWANSCTFRSDHMPGVVEKIREFNDRRRGRGKIPQLSPCQTHSNGNPRYLHFVEQTPVNMTLPAAHEEIPHDQDRERRSK